MCIYSARNCSFHRLDDFYSSESAGMAWQSGAHWWGIWVFSRALSLLLHGGWHIFSKVSKLALKFLLVYYEESTGRWNASPRSKGESISRFGVFVCLFCVFSLSIVTGIFTSFSEILGLEQTTKVIWFTQMLFFPFRKTKQNNSGHSSHLWEEGAVPITRSMILLTLSLNLWIFPK